MTGRPNRKRLVVRFSTGQPAATVQVPSDLTTTTVGSENIGTVPEYAPISLDFSQNEVETGRLRVGHRDVVQQIKFALSRLNDSNGHHEFETICLMFARQRISSNFLPATGPVSAYGDQGRDGETFWSAISGNSSRYPRTVVGDQSVVLGCTLQSSAIASKVKDDLVKIVEGATVDRVAYFIAAPVPVGLRHDLISDAESDLGLKLDIFDLEAISLHLADPDLFWVATEYLHVATVGASALPDSEALPDWYLDIRDRWLLAARPPTTEGDLAELRLLARVATWRADASADLAFAIDGLTDLADSALDSERIGWRAGYEVCVATYRGIGDFVGIESRLVSLVRDAIDKHLDAAFLADANVLLSYGLGASLRSQSSKDLQYWIDLRRQLLDHVADQLKLDLTSNQKVMLLSVESSLAFTISYPSGTPALIAESLEEDLIDGDDLGEDEIYPVRLPLEDIDRGMRAYRDLLALLPGAPMYPVERVASLFDLLTLSLLDHPDYGYIRAGLDDAIAASAGASASADRSMKRALTLANAGEYLAALREASAASLSYWNAHEVAQSAGSMIVEGDLFRVLGLHLAAKSRYLAAAWAAGAHTDDQVNAIAAEALVGAALEDYYLGRWATALSELFVAFDQHTRYFDSALSPDAGYLELATQSFVNCVRFAQSSPTLWRWLVSELEALSAVESPPASTEEMEHIAAQIREACLAPPFSDLADRWETAWISSGVEWRFECANDATSVIAADRLMAVLQRLQFGLSSQNLEWLALRASVQVRVDGDADQRVDQEASELEDEVRFTVVLTPDEAVESLDPRSRMERLDGEAKLLALNLIRAVTLTRDDVLEAALESLFGPGGSFASPAVRQFDESVRIIQPTWTREPDEDSGLNLPRRESIPATPTGLIQHEGLSPLFDEDDVRASVRARYDAVHATLWRTLPRIARDERVMTILEQVHADGALDWQILTAISNLVGTHRVEAAGIDLDDVTNVTRVEAVMRSPESVDEPEFPLELLEERSIGAALEMVPFISLQSYGLASYLRYPNLQAIQTHLASRFAYFEVDESHAAAFEWLT